MEQDGREELVRLVQKVLPAVKTDGVCDGVLCCGVAWQSRHEYHKGVNFTTYVCLIRDVFSREITERPHAPSEVAAFMSAHCKNPCTTPSMDFSSAKGGDTGAQGAAVGICLGLPRCLYGPFGGLASTPTTTAGFIQHFNCNVCGCLTILFYFLISGLYVPPVFQNGAKHLDPRCMFAIRSQHLWCRGSRPKHLSNTDSVMERCNPHCVYGWMVDH